MNCQITQISMSEDRLWSEESTSFYSKSVKRSVMNGAKIFLKKFLVKSSVLGIGKPSNIRLLQCYVALWIHVIDAIYRIMMQRPSHHLL